MTYARSSGLTSRAGIASGVGAGSTRSTTTIRRRPARVPLAEPGLGEHMPYAGVGQDAGAPQDRLVGVDRQVRAAGEAACRATATTCSQPLSITTATMSPGRHPLSRSAPATAVPSRTSSP